MTLRRRTFLGVGIALAAVGVLAMGLTTAILALGFRRLESQSLARDAAHVRKALRMRMAELARVVDDYAAWDDMYEFVASRDAHFLQDNFSAGNLDGIAVDFAVLAGVDGARIFASVAETGDDLVPLEPRAADTVAAWLATLPPDGVRSGLLRVQDRHVVLAAHPVVRSDGAGPPRAMLALGVWLDRELEDRLARALGMDIRVVPVAGGMTGAGESRRTGQAAEPDDDRVVHTQLVLDDVTGTPTALLSIAAPRSIVREGWSMLWLLLAALLLVGAVVLAVILILLDRLVLARIGTLSAGLQEVAAAGDPGRRVPAAGDDEFASLAKTANAMLVSLEEHAGALRQSKEAAEAASRAKSAFLAVMSHELRTPLHAIIGYTDLLLESPVAEDPDVQDDLIRVHQAGVHLLSLVTDVLDTAELEEGALVLRPTRVELRPLLEEVAAFGAELAGRNGNRFALAVGDEPCPMEVDAARLRQVLVNLLSNAAKFTTGGSVTLTARWSDEVVTFAVADTGVGMTPEQLELAFEPFYQGDASSTRSAGGAGLGLALSRRLCRLMGGDLVAESSAGAGSRFTVTLPRGSGAVPAAHPDATAASRHAGRDDPHRTMSPRGRPSPLLAKRAVGA